jgi:hypothetical protein
MQQRGKALKRCRGCHSDELGSMPERCIDRVEVHLKQQLHQASVREAVMFAYGGRCAV